MSAFNFLRQIYSLDTLDTRFTTSSRMPLKIAASESTQTTAAPLQEQKQNAANPLPAGTSPPRWNTVEFYFYYTIFIVAVPLMFKAVVEVSQPSHPSYPKYSGLLSPGWIFGRKVDNSDNQYAGFRENIPYMTVVVVLHPLLRRMYDQVWGKGNSQQADGNPAPGTRRGSVAADSRLKQRLSFDFYFAMLFLAALHGFSGLKILLILYTNFNIATMLPKKAIPASTWIFNIGILFGNELAHGYPYSKIAEILLPFSPAAADWAKFLDGFGGLIPRWEILFKVAILRMISFNLDYHWSLDCDRAGSPLEKKQLDPSSLTERERVSIPAPTPDFTSMSTYLAYVLYSPLYLAGPIVTFNDYISQSRYPSPSVSIRRTTFYGIRFLLTVLTMELVLHNVYAVAISKSSPDWSIYTPFQLAMLGYFNLHIIWLKLLIPWRFFRLWALIDGIDPPENMVRCMSDNYSALAFWRGWHRSFNRWVVRYIYIPLGGGAGGGVSRVRAIINFLAVFTFVALWHDINLRMLMWGWLITLFVLPETIAMVTFPAKKWRDRPETYRVLCGVGAVFNILMMMAANLVGFAVGLDGLKGLVNGIVGSWAGIALLLVACATLFVGVQVMFEVREGEKRKGVWLKC